jgi:hypothetical protein
MLNQITKKKWHPFASLIIESAALVLLVFITFVVWLFYIVWYEKIIPVAPIPEGTRLLQRQPELGRDQFPFHSATARYWYYAKYSTTMPYEEVRAFYEGKYNASPFGVFSVDIWPPVTTPVMEAHNRAENTFLSLPLKRLKDDPLNETLIIVEVSKEPFDAGTGQLVLCFFPFALAAGFCVIGYKYYREAKQAKLHN